MLAESEEKPEGLLFWFCEGLTEGCAQKLRPSQALAGAGKIGT